MTTKQIFIAVLVWCLLWGAVAYRALAASATTTVRVIIQDEVSSLDTDSESVFINAQVPCNPANCATTTQEEPESTSLLSRVVTWLRGLF